MATNQEISVRVGSPVQVKGSTALELPYYVYPISLKLPGFSAEKQFGRRYADFNSLRSQLCASNWYCIVPPIPEKDAMAGTLNKMSLSSKEAERTLLDYRQSALRLFLLRVTHHPIIGKDALLHQFTDDNQWRQAMREPVHPPKFISTSFADGLTKSWATTLSAKVAGAAYNRELKSDHIDPQALEATRLYAQQLESSIRLIKERLHALTLRRKSSGTALFDFASAFEKINEGEEDKELGEAIVAVSAHSKKVSQVFQDQSARETTKVVNTLGFYVGMCAALGETLSNLQSAFQSLEMMSQRVQELENSRLRAAPDAQGSLQNELNILNEQRLRLERTLREAEQTFKEEFQRFHQTKQSDMMELLKVFGELQLSFVDDIKAECNELIPLLQTATR